MKTDWSSGRGRRISPSLRGRFQDFGILALIAAPILWIGWRRWTHAFIDFGRELYVPWQLSQGRILYRDIAYFNGPVSPYLNALIFRTFGVSLTTLILFNLVLLALITWLLHRLLALYTDRLTAFAGCALFLLVFALGDLVGFGNYNFVTPYSHEMTHATLWSLLLLLTLGASLRRPSSGRSFATGVLLGLLFVTKAEFFVAAVAATLTGLVFEHRQGRRISRQIGSLLLGCTLVPVATAAWLLTQTSVTEAIHGALGPWPYVFLGQLTELEFYRKGMGTDTPVENLVRLGTWLGVYGLLFVPVWWIGRWFGERETRRRWAIAIPVLWVALILLVVAPRFGLSDLPRPLPVILALAVLVFAWPILRQPRGDGQPDEWRQAAAVTRQVFALALLAKMVLNTRFHNYGFALALPATMVLVELLLYWIPRHLERRGGYGPAFRAAGTVFVVLVGIAFAWPSILVFQQKQTVVGEGHDHFFVQHRYALAATLLERLPEFLANGETLLVLPEGVMLNYQLRVANPTPYINFMPPEMIMFGEGEIVRTLAANPPDVIVLLKRRTIEYGFETIGDGYGEDLMRWVGDHYPIVETLEEPGLYGKNFGKAFVLRYHTASP